MTSKTPKNWPDVQTIADRRAKYPVDRSLAQSSIDEQVPPVLRDRPEFRQLEAEYQAVNAARIRVIQEQNRWVADRDRQIAMHEEAVRQAVARNEPIPAVPNIEPLPYLQIKPGTHRGSPYTQELLLRGVMPPAPQDEVVNLAAREYDDMLAVIVSTARGLLIERADEYMALIADLSGSVRSRVEKARRGVREAERALALAEEATGPFDRAVEKLQDLTGTRPSKRDSSEHPEVARLLPGDVQTFDVGDGTGWRSRR